MSPAAAPPPCQVEAQENNSPPKYISKQEKCAAKRQRQYTNRTIKKAKQLEIKSENRLLKLENLLYAATGAMSKSKMQCEPEHDPYPMDADMVALPQPLSWDAVPSTDLCNMMESTQAEDELKQKVLAGKVPTAIADSGASSSVGKQMLESDCGKYGLAMNPLAPTGIKSNKIFQYGGGPIARATDVRHLPYKARGGAKEIHMVPGTQKNLLSTNKLVVENYIKVFDKDEVNVYDANDIKIQTTRGAILRGWRVPSEGLWRFPLVPDAAKICNLNTQTAILRKDPSEVLASHPPPKAEGINNVYELKTKPELIRYYHAAAGFPTKPSWLAAIKNGHYKTWPGLDAETAARYFPESDEMWKGHGRKVRSGLRSTKTIVEEEAKAVERIKLPNEKTVYMQEFDLADEVDRKIFSDQTGRFPVTSYKGCQYIMVLFESGSNNILVEAMRSRTASEMVRAYQVLIDRLKEAGVCPTKHILDNECSKEFKKAIHENKMTYQLVPPNDHRRNVAERQYRPSKIILWQCCVEQIRRSHYNFGAKYCAMPKTN